MTKQLASDIRHYDQRLTAALSNFENDKNVLDTNRKKIKQFLEYSGIVNTYILVNLLAL